MADENRNFQASSNEIFLYDDFFSPKDDPGIEIRPMIRGRAVPIHVRRGLSLVAAAEARNRASTHILNRQTGMPEVVAVDETRMNILLLQASIVSWPFQYPDGSPVPINEETIGDLLGDVAGAVLTEIQVMMQGREASLVPFEQPSGVA